MKSCFAHYQAQGESVHEASYSRGMHFFDLDRIGEGLPVAAARAELEEAARTGAVVVTAPPGTGKSTFVPPLIANLFPGRTLLTQPRRVAVRAAARRIAELDGGELGGAVGFTVRGERRISRETRIEALTPGVLLRRLVADPSLEGVGAVILDEVHERSLDGDLLLGMVSEVRALRDDLVVVAMSATLDATGIAALIEAARGSGSAPIVSIPAALHPLSVEHAPFAGQRLDHRGVTRDYLSHLASVTLASQLEARRAGSDQCDALVFVPGAREVDTLVTLLREHPRSGGLGEIEVLPLHGRIPAREQDRAVRGRSPGDPARIVVSTSLAESSLTVPGVRLVIDSGLSREPRRDREREMTGLVTVSASRASAEQRAGRAARLGPGTAVRAYSEAEFAHMLSASAPEIASADLLDATLLLAAWGTPGGHGLALPTPPPQAAMSAATDALRTLGLTDDAGFPTALGARIAQMPLGVREARALLEGTERFGSSRSVAEVIAAISDDHREPGADLGRLLAALRNGSAPGAVRWRRETKRLGAITGVASTSSDESNRVDAGAVVALARPEWIARRAAEHSRSYLFASGTRAALPEGSGLLGTEWIAVHQVQRAEGRAADGTGAVIRLAAALKEADALDIASPLLSETRVARIADARVRVRTHRSLGAIVLASTPTAALPEDSGPAFAAHLHEHGLAGLDWRPDAAGLRNRLALLHRTHGEPWPDVRDAALLERLEEWLLPDLRRLKPTASLGSIDLCAALRRLLPWPEAARFDELAPEALTVPSGSRVRIDYPDAGDENVRPTVSVKLQEMFGLAKSPRIAEDRAPILFHLLSPAKRPLAVTDDLASFWNGPYQDVRKEMRGRYPKHPWPEDPWSAPATSRTKRAAPR